MYLTLSKINLRKSSSSISIVTHPKVKLIETGLRKITYSIYHGFILENIVIQKIDFLIVIYFKILGNISNKTS